MDSNGLIHIYTGEGKGKTTAAIGLACRAAGVGQKVLIVQFLKGSDTGELASLKMLGIKVERGDVKKFIPYMTQDELTDCKKQQENCFKIAKDNMDKFDLLVLDEIIGAVSMNMIDMEAVVKLIQNKPKTTELVLTGRGSPDELVGLADYVSEIKCIKHPFQKGIKARKGIEF
jgi:cob(I)alamin adenosyltransferase